MAYAKEISDIRKCGIEQTRDASRLKTLNITPRDSGGEGGATAGKEGGADEKRSVAGTCKQLPNITL